jgi:hypothetical protein
MRTRLLLGLLVLATGCYGSVAAVQPHPNVVFAQNSTKSLLLRIQKSVPDQFGQSPSDNFQPAIDSWHESLANGFRNGFAGYFAPTPANSAPDLRLELERADLQWAAVGQFWAAQVIYRARLVDHEGHTIAVASGTAASKMTFGGGNSLGPCVSSSVETMYEELSDKLLHRGLNMQQSKQRPPTGATEI